MVSKEQNYYRILRDAYSRYPSERFDSDDTAELIERMIQQGILTL